MSKQNYPKHPAFDAFRASNKCTKQFIHNHVYDYMKEFAKPEMQNAEVSKNTARNIVSSWYNHVGIPVPDFDKETDIKKEPLKTNFLLKQDVTDKVIALALYYLEHGNITDEQRKYLHKILAKSSPSDSWKKTWCFEAYIMLTGMILVVFLMIYNNLGITPEQVKDIFLGWCFVSLGIDLGLLFSMTVPQMYYTHKFNNTLKQR